MVIGCAFVLMWLPGRAHEQLALGIRATVLQPFLAVQQGLVSARVQAADAAILQARIDTLQASLLSYAPLIEEYEQALDLLDLSEQVGPQWRAARALRLGSNRLFSLDVGREDGVSELAPVVSGEGLVGMVREVQFGRSVAMDWSHPDFRAAAMNEEGTIFGLVSARAGFLGERSRMLLTGAPFTTPLAIGTVLVTSGAGGVFPRGIPIGRVAEAAEAEGGWQRSYWIDPFVTPGDVIQTLVAVSDSISVVDVSASWPPRQRGTAYERARSLGAAVDSLAVLNDSIAVLRQRLDPSATPMRNPGRSSPSGSSPPGRPSPQGGSSLQADPAPRGGA